MLIRSFIFTFILTFILVVLNALTSTAIDPSTVFYAILGSGVGGMANQLS